MPEARPEAEGQGAGVSPAGQGQVSISIHPRANEITRTGPSLRRALNEGGDVSIVATATHANGVIRGERCAGCYNKTTPLLSH